MPSVISHQQEVCFPCKYFKRHLWMSGLHPIYHSFCEHPTQRHDRPVSGLSPSDGRFIGEDETRPQWCPIRGNKAAELEADADWDEGSDE